MRPVALALAALCLTSPALLHAQRPSRDWAPEDRVILGDFSIIRALATSTERLYVVGSSGVMIWRPIEQRWEGPWSPPDPRILERAFTALVDPLDQSLWIGRPEGWVQFQPELRLWSSGVVPGRVSSIALDLDDPSGGLKLLAGGRWYRAPPGGTLALPSSPPVRPLRPMTVEDLLRAVPSLRANAGLILRDARGRTVQFSAAAESPDRQGWYIGTNGGGLLFLQTGSAMPERRTFGLAGERAGAVFEGVGGVWVATDRTPLTDPSLSFVSRDLTKADLFAGGPTFGLGYAQARMMTGVGNSLYIATDAGVTQVELQLRSTRFFDMGKGLPDSRANVVLGYRQGVLVGTPRGIARITEAGLVQRLAPDYIDQVTALAAEGDDIWMGTTDGLVLLEPEARMPGRTPGLMKSASYRAPVLRIAWLADTLVALLPDAMIWRLPGTDDWRIGPNLSGSVGRLRVFTPSGDGFFVAGERGFGYASLNSPIQRPFLQGDNPGLVRDMVADEEYLWVATERGLVRWRLTVVRP